MRIPGDQGFLPCHSASQDHQGLSCLAQFSQGGSDFALAERQIQERLRVAWIHIDKTAIDIQSSTILRECSMDIVPTHQHITDLFVRERPVASGLNVFWIGGTERFKQTEFLPEVRERGGQVARRHER